MISNIFLSVILLCMSIDDIKHKSISLKFSCISIALAVLMSVFVAETEILNSLLGVFTGATVTVVIKLIGLNIGMGDGICYIFIGAAKGMLFCMEVVVTSVMFISVGCGIFLLLKFVKKDTEIPFVPFIFASCLGVIACG